MNSAPRFALLASLLVACTGKDVVLGDGPPRSEDASSVSLGPSFSEPVAIEAVSTSDTIDDDPSLSADLTEMYFNSKREGGLGEEDIWRSMRASPDDAWSAPEHVLELATSDRETGIALAEDALTIWFSSDRPDSLGGLDVFTATRETRSAPWSDVRRVEELSTPDDDLVSAVADGRRTILLARRGDADDDYDIFIAKRDGTEASWQSPAPIAELNTEDEESDGFSLGGGKELIFTREQDLHLARRDAPSGPFSAAEPLTELNSQADDRDVWASRDAAYVVFSSDRSGSYLLYEVRASWNAPE